ncbi:MAG: hypothetical protein CMM01_03275 [Rhodopirellula sp.]|nr:hypothetical protein [Rhodopirellula sp.]
MLIDDWAWSESQIAMDASMPNFRMPMLKIPNIEIGREEMMFTNAGASPVIFFASSLLAARPSPHHATVSTCK